MDRSGHNNNGNYCNFGSRDHDGGYNVRLVEGNFFRQKRKRGDDFLSASNPQIQDGGEVAVESPLVLLGQRSRQEEQTTSKIQQQHQLEDIDRYRLQNEQLRRENDELKRQLQERNEENIKLREELEQEKQKWLQTDHNNKADQPNTNIVPTTTEMVDTHDVSTGSDDHSTDPENGHVQLSSNSSMEQQQQLNNHSQHERMNDNYRDAGDGDSDEKKEALADHVIYNDDKHSLILQVLDLHQSLISPTR